MSSLSTPRSGPLDYRVSEGMAVDWVDRGRTCGAAAAIGLAWKPIGSPTTEVPDARLRPLAGVLDVRPIAAPLRRLCEWTADYYLSPLASVLRMVLPPPPRSMGPQH